MPRGLSACMPMAMNPAIMWPIFTPWPVSRPRPEQLVEHIKRTLYNTSSSGYAGNDDCGEMSAWYVFSALGFYPVNPASGEYVIGSPTVDHAEIMLPGGKKFTIVVKRKGGAGAAYVKSVKLNGHKLDGYVLKHADIMKGGTLEFEMVTRPERESVGFAIV